MKSHTIEVQRVKALAERHGLIEMRVDALVLPASAADGAEPGTRLSFSLDTARTLQLLLKAQLAEVDKRKGRSQR